MQRGGKGRVEVSAYIYGRTTPFGLSTGRYCKSFNRLSGPCLKHISRGRCDHIPTRHIPLTQANPAPTPMAHIISCMLDSDSDDIAPSLHNYIAKAVSPQTSNESVCNHSIPPQVDHRLLPLAKAYLFSLGNTARQRLPFWRQALHLENDAPDRAEVPALPQGQAATSCPWEVSGPRAGLRSGHGTEWREERQDHSGHRLEDTNQRTQPHPQAESQRSRAGPNDDRPGGCHGFP